MEQVISYCILPAPQRRLVILSPGTRRVLSWATFTGCPLTVYVLSHRPLSPVPASELSLFFILCWNRIPGEGSREHLRLYGNPLYRQISAKLGHDRLAIIIYLLLFWMDTSLTSFPWRWNIDMLRPFPNSQVQMILLLQPPKQRRRLVPSCLDF